MSNEQAPYTPPQGASRTDGPILPAISAEQAELQDDIETLRLALPALEKWRRNLSQASDRHGGWFGSAAVGVEDCIDYLERRERRL